MIKAIFHIFHDSPNSFEGQKEGERVIMLLRRHPFTILLKMSVFLIIGLAPILVSALFADYLDTYNLFQIFLLVSSLWYLGLWLVMFQVLTLYTLNTVIITSERIIDSDQHGLFNRKISELHKNRIQDVSSHTNGLFETMLKFGNVIVQTAASEKHFVFRQIPDPNQVKDTIMHITGARHSGVMVK